MPIFPIFKQKIKNYGQALVKKVGKYFQEDGLDTSTRQGLYNWFLHAYNTVPLINSIINVQSDQVVQDFYFEGPTKEKLEKWAEDVNLMRFFHRITKNMLIFGNAYVEVIHDGNTISKLKILNPIWMDVYRSKLGKVSGYSQIIEGSKLILWGSTGYKEKDKEFQNNYGKFNQIIHFKYNVVGSDKYGKSVIEPLIDSIKSKVDMESKLGELLKKYIAPLIWAKVGSNEMPASDAAVSNVAGTLRDLHAESEIVTSHLVELQVLDFNQKGMDIKTPLDQIDQQIVTGGQTPAILLGITKDGSDKSAEVQLRSFGRHIKSIQREVKVEFEDKIIVGQGIGSSEDKLVWTKAEEREWEIDTDIMRGLVTDGVITAQKANDLLPPKYQEKLPEIDPLNGQGMGMDGQQIPRASQRVDKKVKDNPKDPTQTTQNKNAKGRVVKNDRKVPLK